MCSAAAAASSAVNGDSDGRDGGDGDSSDGGGDHDEDGGGDDDCDGGDGGDGVLVQGGGNDPVALVSAASSSSLRDDRHEIGATLATSPEQRVVMFAFAAESVMIARQSRCASASRTSASCGTSTPTR